MRSVLKKVLPVTTVEYIRAMRAMSAWKSRGYLDNAPQFVKERIFIKYGIPHTQWVETGTYLGTTTDFLEKNFSKVYSIEPSAELYRNAVARFKGRHVKLLNGTSETVLPDLLRELSGDCNFWLDGHYSAGITFKGDVDCPVEDELSAIENNLERFSKISILIDDVRCFVSSSSSSTGYPSIDSLVDWARRNHFHWRIEQDIFIIRNFL